MFDYIDGNIRNPLGVFFGFSFFNYLITQFDRNLFITLFSNLVFYQKFFKNHRSQFINIGSSHAIYEY